MGALPTEVIDVTGRPAPGVLWVLVAALVVAAAAGCHTDPAPNQPDIPVSRVFIVGTELLAAPAVGREASYAPEFLGSIDPDDPNQGEVAGFYLRVVTGRPDALKMRLVDTRTQTVTDLVDVPAPDRPPPDEGLDLADLEPTVRDLLLSGTAVFWRTDRPDEAKDNESRLAVLIPESLRSSLGRLEVFVSEVSTGAPLGADRILLARDFFYLAAIGDSAMWGNGLREEDKFTTLVANEIERETGKKVIRQVYAISGASIVPSDDDGVCRGNCTGEVPRAWTSITTQAELVEEPRSMDLILVDGGGNDVGLYRILSVETDPAELEELTRQYCEGEMIGLLRRVRQLAPQAHIVVTGYFPFLSEESDFTHVEPWVVAMDSPLFEVDELWETIAVLTTNAAVFHETSRESLANAVDAVNASTSGPPMIGFADPDYGAQNAAFASDPWLWGLTVNDDLVNAFDWGMDLLLFPEDPLLDYRLSACLEPGVCPDLLSCIYASVGHPNPAGARAYADAIIETLRELGVLSPVSAPPASE